MRSFYPSLDFVRLIDHKVWGLYKMEIGDLKKLDVTLSANLAIFFFSFVAPGFLIFYKYEPEIFLSIDVFKLVVLAIAISSPTFVFPFVFTALYANVIAKDMPDQRYLWGAPSDWYLKHGVGNALNMYTIIATILIFDLSGSWLLWLIMFTVFLNLIVETAVLLRFKKHPSSVQSVWFERFSISSTEGSKAE